MAESKVKFKVDADDGGTLKKLGKNAEKAGKATEKVAKSTRTADRNIKGVASASSGASKNFSKMSQGMTGGIVPAYAVLAANIFAISAAFRFLKSAADVKNLQASQVQFAATTGSALGLMTERLREASGGMLGLKEAGQATAIGMAQGFSGAQMEKLTEGAKKVSVALGRDFEDSFDRLVRGASKAEPELLDELGIVLRLKTATENYAATIGKEVTMLTAAERSQAVMIETMKQLDDKYSEVEGRENPFTQLKTTFDDIVRAVTEFVLPIFESLARFISANAKVAVIAFGLLALSIMKSILPFGKMGKAVDDWGKKMERNITASSHRLKRLKRDAKNAADVLAKVKQEGTRAVTKGAGEALKQGGQSKALQAAGSGTMTKAQQRQLRQQITTAEKQIKKHGKVIRGTFKGVSKSIVKDMSRGLKKVERKSAGLGRRFKSLGKRIKLQVTRPLVWMGKKGAQAFLKIGRAAKVMGKMTAMAMKASIILAGFQMVYELLMKIVDAPFTIVKSMANMMIKVIEVMQMAWNGIKRAFAGVVNWIKEGIQKMIDKVSKFKEFFGGDPIEFSITPMIVEPVDVGGGKIIDWLANIEEVGWVASLAGWEEGRQAIKSWKDAMDELKQSADTTATTMSTMIGSWGKKDVADSGLKKLMGKRDEFAEMQDNAEVASYNAAIGRFRTEAISSLGIAEDIKTALGAAKGDKDNIADASAALIERWGTSLKLISPRLLVAVENMDYEEATRLEALSNAFNANEKSITDSIDTMITQLDSGDLYASEAFVRGLQNTRDSVIATSEELDLATQAAEKLDKAFQAFGGVDTYLLELKSARTEQIAIAREAQQLGIDKAASRRLPAQSEAQRGLEIKHQEEMNKLRKVEFDIRQKTNMLRLAETERDPVAVQKLTDELAGLQAVREAQEFNAKLAEEAATASYQILDTMGNSIEKNLISGLTAVVQGTKSLKEAFKEMALSILKDITAIITKMMVMQALDNSNLFGMFSSTPAPKLGTNTTGATSWGQLFSGGGGSANPAPWVKKGGIVSPPEYARGGISKSLNKLDGAGSYPALLHGTEAVVPLPNGRSIPVDMKGGTNNIVVNVSGEGGNTQAQGDKEGLGRALARAVQEELQNQKRSGGILNPYGVA